MKTADASAGHVRERYGSTVNDPYMMDGSKIRFWPDRIAEWMKDPRKTVPIHMDCGLTKTCNARCTFCLRADTMILMADFTWKRIDGIEVGDMVIGFSEKAVKGEYARYAPTRVTKVMSRKDKTLRIEAGAARLNVTKEHPLLMEGHRWRKAGKVRSGQKIRFFSDVYANGVENWKYRLGYLKGVMDGDGSSGHYEYDHSEINVLSLRMKDIEAIERARRYVKELYGYDLREFIQKTRGLKVSGTPYSDLFGIRTTRGQEVKTLQADLNWKSTIPAWAAHDYHRGYLAGVFDAEGTCNGTVVRIAQKANLAVRQNIAECFKLLGFKYVEESTGIRLLGGYQEIARFFGETRPAIVRKYAALYGRSIPATRRIDNVARSHVPETVYNFETESHTYVANGFAVHNCYAFSQGGMTGEKIPREALLSFVEDAAELGVKSLAWIGDGEPTLNPAMWEATALAHLKGVKVAIATNGLLFDPGPKIQLLAWMRFNFSAGPKRYNEVMGLGGKAYDKVCRNIRATCEARDKYSPNTHIGLQMVPMPDYMDECVEVARIGKELGCNYTVIKQCTDSAWGGIGPKQITVPSIDDYRAKMPELKKAEALSDEKYKVIVKWNTMMTNGRRQYNRCYGTRFLPQLSGNGELYTCGPMFRQKEYLLGDITKQRFKDIVFSEQWEKGHRLAESIDVHTVCSTSCRQNALNRDLWELKDEVPLGVAFI